MGKKAKVGKQRRDKAYWSAKEIGFRSRASFKLIQLNRKFEFLQKSRVCVDLCAAPGSWMQVAKENMPVSSLIIGVDLVPIKPIPGCICMVSDITTDKCRADLKRELQGWKTDLVLHDGAPNVGKSWVYDAYQQSLLTLSAFKLATELLRQGGSFITKIFRSKDYQSLLWVFNQFFKRVHSTKPPASRAESAEIFVVCLGYKAPDKIDPRFLDAKSVFSELNDGISDAQALENETELVNPEKKKRKPAAEGYDSLILYKQAKASEFIAEDKPIHILNNYNQIVLDKPWIRDHPKTTKEIVECLSDIKVLGIKELRFIKKWREALKVDYEAKKKEEAENKGDSEMAVDGKDEEDEDKEEVEELKKLEEEIENLNDEERRIARRKKKRELREKRKRAEKIDLKMVIPGDKGPTLQEEGLFNIKDIKTGVDVNRVMEENEADILAESDEDDGDDADTAKPKLVKYAKDKGSLDKYGLYYKGSDEEDNSENENSDKDSDEDVGNLGLDEDNLKGAEDAIVDKLNDPPSNPLLFDLDTSDRNARRKKKAEMWFDKDVFKGIDDDEELEEADIACAIKSIKKKGGVVLSEENKKKKEKKSGNSSESGYTSDEEGGDEPMDTQEDSDDTDDDDSDDSDDSDSDYDVEQNFKGQKTAVKEKDGFEVVPEKKAKKKDKKRKALTPEELALGQEMVISKKRKRDLLDGGWNRYMFDDRDEDLPDWFVHEEQYHMRKRPEVDPATVEFYRQKQKELNVRTIKKVVEAKARKKRRMTKKLDKAKKRAAAILENADLGMREKAKEINKMYKRIKTKEKKEVIYTVAKKHSAAKRPRRPAGVKGIYKQVDPRMKKDNTTKRSNATSKKNQKRRLKGRKTRTN